MIFDKDYLELLEAVLQNGHPKTDRTGIGTYSLSGCRLEFDLSQGHVPLLNSKRVSWKTAARELLWMLSGETNILPLIRQGVHIWTNWPFKKYKEATGVSISPREFENQLMSGEIDPVWGELGPVYGKQWRKWEGHEGHIDQIEVLTRDLVSNPYSRRHILEGWNVADLPFMTLPPCHKSYQFIVQDRSIYDLTYLGSQPIPVEFKRQGRPELDCIVYQRSCDAFLGLPFNMFNAALLTRMMAQVTGHHPGKLIWIGGDCHVYLNHISAVREQLSRDRLSSTPTLQLNHEIRHMDNFKLEDIEVVGYSPKPAIKAEVAV